MIKRFFMCLVYQWFFKIVYQIWCVYFFGIVFFVVFFVYVLFDGVCVVVFDVVVFVFYVL